MTTSSIRSRSGPDPVRGSVPDAEEALAAVLARDAAYDGRFLFAVVTTGVYCRPGCSSRTPRRENIRFFGTAADAEAAGFRACKRCRPESDRPSSAEVAIDRARQYLDAHLDEKVTLDELARVAHVSAHHLQRTFKRRLGLTPRQYVEVTRADRLKARLRAGEPVTRAIFEAGYGSTSRAYERAPASLGMTPALYSKGGPGVRIRFVIESTPLGRLLVAATDRGVCAVSLGDDDAVLEAELRHEYPRASIDPAAGELGDWVGAIVGYLEGAARELPVPVDVRATAFQWRVWSALRDVPFGETRTYRQLAESIGRPTAARAVARACATNRVALVIPCHRIVRGDGGPGGYRWGLERKRLLLQRESGGELPD